MPFRPRRVQRRRKVARRGRARRMISKVLRKAVNQSQVFTETVKAQSNPSYGISANGTIDIQSGTQFTPGKFSVQMNMLDANTFAAYRNLYQSYKILKASVIIVPKFTETDPNMAAGLAPTTGVVEAPRITYAVNNSTNDLLAPVNELDVLADNGCKIRKLTRPLKIKFNPVAAIDGINPQNPTHNVALQYDMKPWIGFDGDGSIIPHVGVDFVVSQGNTLTAGFSSVADV